MVTQLAEKSPHVMEFEASLLCTQQLATDTSTNLMQILAVPVPPLALETSRDLHPSNRR
jgi:hypothetical protein